MSNGFVVNVVQSLWLNMVSSALILHVFTLWKCAPSSLKLSAMHSPVVPAVLPSTSSFVYCFSNRFVDEYGIQRTFKRVFTLWKRLSLCTLARRRTIQGHIVEMVTHRLCVQAFKHWRWAWRHRGKCQRYAKCAYLREQIMTRVGQFERVKIYRCSH